VEQFGGSLLDMLNHGALAVGVSIGHRTRLFDAMAEMEPASSEAVAKRAGLQERYVREWLGAMVLGGIIEHDAERDLLAPARARGLPDPRCRGP
jgi:hypothetical protein